MLAMVVSPFLRTRLGDEQPWMRTETCRQHLQGAFSVCWQAATVLVDDGHAARLEGSLAPDIPQAAAQR